jgi:hypothetical protein
MPSAPREAGESCYSDPTFGTTLFSDMVNRIPGGSRFTTLTEPPNKERTRYATAGPSPRSPPGVSVSAIENTSKNFGIAVLEIVKP